MTWAAWSAMLGLGLFLVVAMVVGNLARGLGVIP